MGHGRSYYEVLGVAPSASMAEVRRAYVQKARTVHPDVRGGADASAMQAVNEAWHVLRDPGRRLAYDRGRGLRSAWAGPGAGPEGPQSVDEPEPVEEWVAADLPEDPGRPARAGDLVMMVPAALVAVFAVTLSVAFVMGSAPLLALAFGALLLAGAGFVVLPFLTMARQRRQG